MVSSPKFSSALTLRTALLANREQALTQLYRHAFPLVRRHVSARGGTAEDAQDVFHDALVILYEQAVGGTLTLTATAGTYLLGISRNLWRHELRRRARLPHEALPDDPGQLAAEAATETEATGFAVLDYVEQLGARCKNMLLAFYYFQQPLTQIAEANGYRSVRSATVQKFKCLERLRNSVRRAFHSETIEY
ncbi:RNA polymerase sigma factor [Hymenobacter monticola]|uniref:Sigma-70 family RNA polymerase sigma factor n=1 Tax=Hymenobacter monticola TaxID=1705399 RepID=A0ABY4BBA8_9BACT|nr:sigma-70 family RNA polymerase sigma factor [Hymenobacter monticola]UOE35276.1 sigma-70 family RNA polymerase sigma factor [Hymenobacter monticola]